MKRTPLTAMLTLVAVLTSAFAMAACGGKAASSSAKPATGGASTTTTTTSKHKSKPAY